MGREVAFDYSKAAPFVRKEELENMKSAVMCAKDVPVSYTHLTLPTNSLV